MRPAPAAAAAPVAAGHMGRHWSSRWSDTSLSSAPVDIWDRRSRSALRPDRDPPIAPSIVGKVLLQPGQPLDPSTRGVMEAHFSHDFSRVHIHTDDKAAESARAIHALAYTAGNDVVFARGQFSPASLPGRRLLAHELAHVVQQQASASTVPRSLIGPSHDELEREAADAADAVSVPGRAVKVRGKANDASSIQRFSTAEHKAIGDAAYQDALPQNTSASQAANAPKLDQGVADSLRNFRYRHGDKQSTYGDLVTMADEVASFQLLEEQDKERAGKGFRVPVLSRIWDSIGDQSHYLDLAARNLQHFHPHNFKAWQGYHWTALRAMKEAYGVQVQADELNSEIVDLLKEFDAHQKRSRRLLEKPEHSPDAADKGASRAVDEESKLVEQDLNAMAQILATVAKKQQRVAELRDKAKGLAVHALALNGFGDHFLTDAYAGGHIVTPRKDLLESYATKLLGLIEVGGVLNCASIPSLAWHDLDNKRGVRVKNRAGDVWTTYGDNYLAHAAPTNEKTTMGQVVKATARSIRHMWESAAGRQPTSLMDVLELLPAPILDPAIYPNWTADEWNIQLRFAAGEQVGMNYDAMGVGRGSSQPTEHVPEPKGNQIGAGPLSARATCLNAISAFSYANFVEPMLVRIRREYNERFFTGSEGQILPSTAEIKTQASVVGHAAIGSIIGALVGIGIGFLAGHGLGALIGGLAGFAAGAFIGGFIGARRDQPETATKATQ